MDHDGIDMKLVLIHVLNIMIQQQAWYGEYKDQKMIILMNSGVMTELQEKKKKKEISKNEHIYIATYHAPLVHY